MSGTMRAWVFRGSGQPLRVEEVPRPSAGPQEVVVSVAGCGLCHTDLHYVDHGVATAKPPPLILGHEISGTIASLGSGVSDWSVGDRVVVPAVLPCGACPTCRSGRENICPKMRMLGNHIDGGFAESVVVPARDLVRLPESIDLVNGAVIADALSTPFHAVVRRAQVQPGEWVVVVGCGGVGINLVQFSVLAGAQVVAVDLQPEKLKVARRLGATAAMHPSSGGDLVREIREITGGGADVAFEAVGSPATVTSALSSLRRGGRLCLVGYSDQPVSFPTARIMFFEYTVMGSLGCRPVDYPRIVELVKSGRVSLDEVVTGKRPLEQISEAADDLRAGKGLRTVLVP